MGTWFHAKQAGVDPLVTLTPEEQDEVDSWKDPPPLETPFGVLKWSDGVPEREIAVNMALTPVRAIDPDAALTGHPDIYWVVEKEGRVYVCVCDIKATTWHIAEGPRSLQLLGYGIMVAMQVGADGIWTCLYDATRGVYVTPDDGRPMHLDEPSGIEAMARVMDAMKQGIEHADTPVTGAHCDSCYERMRCEAWALPVTQLATPLEALVDTALDGSDPLERIRAMTPEKRVEMLRYAEALAHIADVAQRSLRAAAVSGIEFSDGDKHWAASEVKGRMTFVQKGFKEDFPDLFAKYQKMGEPHVRMGWKKLPKKKRKQED